MLNKVLNNIDFTHMPNIVLNEAPITNDATRLVNNMRLTIMGAEQFSVAAIQPSCKKVDLPETRDYDTKTRKVHADRNKLCPGKEWKLYSQ